MKATTGWLVALLGASSVCAPITALHARPDIEFVTIGDPGNPGYPLASPPGYLNVQGRGAVDYLYRIGKYEVTTAQWMEFVNNYNTLGGQWTYFADPVAWGAVPDPSYTGPGVKYMLDPGLPNAAMVPVSGISWRESAMFCNWLHNGKASGLWAIENGAYDTSMFTTNPNGTFNDQLTHHPDAKFWIPTFDEWTKASHWDPNRYGPGQGGYWLYSHQSEDPPIGGPPGQGQANTGFFLPNAGQFYIPLGSYPETQSPWGLMDTAGATNEHTEFFWPLVMPSERGGRGSWAGGAHEAADRIYFPWPSKPQYGFSMLGLRVASQVPAPASLVILGFAWISWGGCTRRRRL